MKLAKASYVRDSTNLSSQERWKGGFLVVVREAEARIFRDLAVDIDLLPAAHSAAPSAVTMPATRSQRKRVISTITLPAITRSQRKCLLERAASAVEVQEVLRFENEDHLNRFIASAGSNSDVGTALQHLTIELQSAYPLQLLSKALHLAPNLTDLILMLPSPFPRRVLDGLVFVHLRLLKTNLPHSHVVTFLSANSSVRFLDLGPCGKTQTCPLRSANLSRIPDIRCPIECSTTIVHLGTVRVRADLSRPRTVVSTVLRTFPIPFFAIYTLSLQFNATDDDILPSIARFVPMVRVLRLWERADYVSLDPQTPRPWQNATSVRNNLLRMRFLDHFVVRTTASFVSVPGLARERAVVFRWVGENTPSLKHPRLKFVAVWYRATRFGAGTLTKWWKDNEAWEGASVDSPTQDELGVCM